MLSQCAADTFTFSPQKTLIGGKKKKKKVYCNLCLDTTFKSLYCRLSRFWFLPEKSKFINNKWRLEVFAEQQWVILCVPVSVYNRWSICEML